MNFYCLVTAEADCTDGGGLTVIHGPFGYGERDRDGRHSIEEARSAGVQDASCLP